ncbi:unnamed protein product [marine sediment metagenome]|uniref:Uncharacterized protein n=1 Tax=marine sediment metagenome TaxID=412755 RepID=X0T0E1_9ZZZZ
MRIISTENEEVNEEEEQDIEFVDNEETEEDTRLKKSVNRLIKITKIDKEKLKGLTLEEQFDRLEFLADNLPKKTMTSSKKKNKPIVPNPVDIDAPKLGVINKNAPRGVLSMSFNPIDVFKRKIEK